MTFYDTKMQVKRIVVWKRNVVKRCIHIGHLKRNLKKRFQDNAE